MKRLLQKQTIQAPVRCIAFYLPQYHPIPENDAWWGKGFTEWTNVTKAKPLFKGHQQPNLPADLGFYDLRVPEVRQAQADLARWAGIEGFCYWHYWFAGKQLLERPFIEVLSSGKPDFPFCLAWANQTWSGIWHGSPDKILMEQTYPGEADHRAHFDALMPAFKDPRYITVDGKPLFVLYRPMELPEPAKTLQLWQDMAISAGLKGLFIVGVNLNEKDGLVLRDQGFDAFTLHRQIWRRKEDYNFILKLIRRRFGLKRMIRWYQKILKRPYHVFDFSEVSQNTVVKEDLGYEYFPSIIPNFDNSPRSGINGYIGVNSTPELLKQQLQTAINRVENYPDQHKIVFIKSWNEWAEGNYLEPDQRHGTGYLRAIKDVLESLEQLTE